MKLVWLSAFFITLGVGVSAQEYRSWQTDHFGFAELQISEEFSLTGFCTVSGGETADSIDEIGDWLPFIGDSVLAAINWATLEEGEVLCGLRHYRGPGPWTYPSASDGFEIIIRAYLDGTQIGSDLSPSRACRSRGILNVNRFGVCYEKGGASELDREEADYVVACIEVTPNATREILSFLVFAGDAPEEIASEVTGVDTNVQGTTCLARRF